MSGLYPDESHCTSEIGTLLFKPKTDWTGTVRVVDIVSTKGLAGTHNDYILEFKLVPRQILELDSRIFTLTSRFRELDKLHKGLAKTHKQLYLRGVFPTFAPTKLIGSGEPTVVAERRYATEVFLNFVLDHEVLRKSVVLHQFLDKALEKVHTADSAEDEVYSTIDTGINPSSYLESPTEELPTSGIATVQSLTGEIDFQFPEVALGDLPHHTTSKIGLRRQFPELKMDLEAPKPNTADYLVRAGILISTAQKAEAENEFELAFQCYKNAARNLSDGLRTETDSALRNSVKLKTAKYIVRAEQLFRTYLSYDGSAFNLEGLLSDTLHLQDPTIFAFKCSNGGLKDYSVVGVLPYVKAQHKVLLMEERTTGNRYVLKFLDKGREDADTRIVLPTSVPHMAQLYKFFETEDHIILLLEHVSNGRLYDFLNRTIPQGNILKRSKTTPPRNDEEAKKQRRYSYTGQRLHFSVGFDIERVVAMRDEQQSTADPSNCEVVCAMGEDCAADADDSHSCGGEFYITQSSVEEAPEVQEEQPAEVKFRNPPARQYTSKSTTDSLYSCLKEVRELLLARRSWPSGLSIPEPLIIHWTAQIVSFLYMLHHQHNECIGSLLPRSLLLDANGNLVMTYHGRWFTQNNGKLDGLRYSAPESKDINWKPSVPGDVYTLGCMLFELTTGTSLYEAAPHGLTRDSEEIVNEKRLISMPCWDLLLKLLAPENERCSLEEVRAHSYYSMIDWNLYDNPHASALPNKNRVNHTSAPVLAQLDPLDSTNLPELDSIHTTNSVETDLTASSSQFVIPLTS